MKKHLQRLFLAMFALNALALSDGHGMKITFSHPESPVIEDFISKSDDSGNETTNREERLCRGLELCDEYKTFLKNGYKLMTKHYQLIIKKRDKNTYRPQQCKYESGKDYIITTKDTNNYTIKSEFRAVFDFLYDLKKSVFFKELKNKYFVSKEVNETLKICYGFISKNKSIIINYSSCKPSLKIDVINTTYAIMDLMSKIKQSKNILIDKLDKIRNPNEIIQND
jgi:hypothetical protein